jgi:hypothetical protein
VNASQVTRANRDGHPCPRWCTADHDEELVPGYFSLVHKAEIARVGGVISRPVLLPARGHSQVQAGAPGHSLTLDPDDAERAAVLVEELANATPEQHRELATAIRQAAAVITEADQ